MCCYCCFVLLKKNFFFQNVYAYIHMLFVCFFMRYFCSFRSIWHWMFGLCLIHCTISTHNFWIHAINILFETSTMMAASTRISHTLALTHTHTSQQTTHDQRSAKHCHCQICYQQWMYAFVKNLMYVKFQSSGCIYVDASIIHEAQLLPIMSLCLPPHRSFFVSSNVWVLPCAMCI